MVEDATDAGQWGEREDSDTDPVRAWPPAITVSGSASGRRSVAGPLTLGTVRNEIIPVITARLYGFLRLFHSGSPDIYRVTQISRHPPRVQVISVL